LVVEKLDRMDRISQSPRILTGTVHAHPKATNLRFGESLLDGGREGESVFLWDEVGRYALGMLGKALRERPEGRTGVGPQDFIRTHLSEGRNRPLLKGGFNRERERSAGILTGAWHSEWDNPSRGGH